VIDLQQNKGRILWVLILFFYILYAGAFIYRTSFVIDGQRYFSLFDDTMISMRYAKNLANGQGLVWNPGGEKVEGFSNPLWVVFMAFFHLFPISPSKISLFIQISGAIFMILNLYLVKRIADIVSGGSIHVALGTVALTAFYLPLNNWALQGTEVSLLTLLMSLVVWKTLRFIKEDSFSFWPYLLMGVGTLIRMDMVVPYLAILIFLLMSSPRHRLKNLGWGMLILLAFSGVQTLVRYSYFHELLPNTYYLKMTGYPLILRLARGVFVFIQFVFRSNWFLFLLPLSIFFFKREKSTDFLFWIILGQVFYSIWVGGDAWESWGGSNRYISIVMPMYFVLFAYSLRKLGELFLYASDSEHPRKRRVISIGQSAFIVFSLINFNVLNDSTLLKNWLLLDPPQFVAKNEMRVREALLLSNLTDEHAVIAVTWAGALPYFVDRNAVDILGKTDGVVAREKVRILSWPGKSILSGFLPGHMKWDYPHSFSSLNPDVIAQAWLKFDKIEGYLDKYYVKRTVGKSPMYFRKNSPHVFWDKLKEEMPTSTH
jgi:hypothetical protein